MQTGSKKLFKIMIVLTALLMAVTILMVLSRSERAGALAPSEWETVRSAIDSYITGQFEFNAEGEAGYRINSGALEPRLDSNGDWDLTAADAPGSILGEGDDAANAPVLVDNLIPQNNVIPGTSVRCTWNGTATTGCLETNAVNVIRNRVDAHAAAGFSTDVVVYCLTAHTEAPTTGGLGIISAAGGLGPEYPEVRGLMWGRNGWTNTLKTYTAANPLGSPLPPTWYENYASQPMTACDGKAGSELVRCAAAWAISPTGGNVGSGGSWSPTAPLQPVDVRTGDLTGRAIPGSVQIPINTLFNTGLLQLNPGGAKKLFVGRTQIGGGVAAIGAEMLGYDSTFLQWGMPNYNYLLDEKQVADHPTFATIPAQAGDPDAPAGPGPIEGVDTTAPVVSSVTLGNISNNSVDIHRVANEPATMKVEYGTSPGSYSGTLNNTVLNADKTVTLTGLSPDTDYYLRVTSYDGQANGATWNGDPVVMVRTLPEPDECGRPVLSLGTASPFWASYADYELRLLSVTYPLNNGGTIPAYGVMMTGGTATNGVTLSSAMPVAVGDIAPGTSTAGTLVYSVPAGVAAFRTTISASAMDLCGNDYDYGPPAA